MNLRKEFALPELDENKVRQLAELAERLDGCSNYLEDCDALQKEFNSIANTNLQVEDFHFSGATDAVTFVRSLLIPKPQKIDDISNEEILELITRICNADGTENELEYWLDFLGVQFNNNKLSDLIYYPEHYFGDGIRRDDMSPKEILDELILDKPKTILLLS